MTLTVEDGSNIAGADSYVTLAVYQAYGSARGWTLGDTDEADEINLRRSFDILNREYSWRGDRTYETQVGAWPREYVGYVFGFYVDSDAIPNEVKYAQCELAYLIQGGIDPLATITGVVASTRSKAGPVETETEYLGGLAKPRLVAVDGLLRPYLKAGAGQVALSRA